MTVNAKEAASYRTPLSFNKILLFDNNYSFPVCPRCDRTLEREYQAYCDRCGQCLDWKNFSKAAISRIYSFVINLTHRSTKLFCFGCFIAPTIPTLGTLTGKQFYTGKIPEQFNNFIPDLIWFSAVFPSGGILRNSKQNC